MQNRKTVINLANLEDISAYDMGEYFLSSSKWVQFGKNNDYPSYLRNLYLSSPTHQAIVDGSTNLTTGEGVEVVDPIRNPISNKWLNENFPKDVVKKLIGDLKVYGYCVVEIYNGSLVKYVEALKYRFDVKDSSGQINYMWYSNDWDYYTYRKNAPVKLPVYTEGCDYDVSVFYVQLDRKGYDYYSPVDYNGAINYISLEKEISIYHLNNIRNGLFPSFLINFIGAEFSDEQMDKIEQDINKKFGGSTNSGRAIVGFSANKDDATTLDTIEQPNIDATYTFLSKECSEKILLGHGVSSPLLFGIRDTGGGLGSNALELENSFYLYYESKLKHYQNYILQLIEKIMNGNLLYAEVKFKTYNPFKNLVNTTPTATTGATMMSKYEELNEINSQDILNQIDSIAIKTDDILISEKLYDEENTNPLANPLYKYVKSSNNNTIVNKKFEILSKQGYVFKPDKLIKNCKDYYFIEQKYLKK